MALKPIRRSEKSKKASKKRVVKTARKKPVTKLAKKIKKSYTRG